MRIARTLTATLLGVLLLGCSPKGDVKPTANLYTRLGGKNAIEAVVNDFVENLKGDARVNGKFVNTNFDDFKGKLVDQLCQATGGPCTYGGKDMRAAHLGMGITQAEFTATVEDLTKSLDKFKVPPREKGELLNIVAPMNKDMVEAP